MPYGTFAPETKSGANFFAYVAGSVVTVETLPLFGELKGISKRTAFLKDG